MKKKTIKSTLAVAVLVAPAAFGYKSYTQHQDNQLAYANPLIEENINVLADVPTDGSATFIRTDIDCVYVFKGKAGGNIKFNIGGVSIVNLTIGANGEASYTYLGEKTDCASKDNQQCTSRYCPQLSFM